VFFNNKEFNEEVNSCQFVTKASDHRLRLRVNPQTTLFSDPTCKMTPIQNLKFSGKYEGYSESKYRLRIAHTSCACSRLSLCACAVTSSIN
jgi:hypothetical protein